MSTHLGFIQNTKVLYNKNMEVLEKINQLCKEKNWTIYKLSEESGVNQSTLSNMFSRKSYPSIPTLAKICDAFGISLSEFFHYDLKSSQTSEEIMLLNDYRKLSNKNKKIVKNLISELKEQ